MTFSKDMFFEILESQKSIQQFFIPLSCKYFVSNLRSPVTSLGEKRLPSLFIESFIYRMKIHERSEKNPEYRTKNHLSSLILTKEPFSRLPAVTSFVEKEAPHIPKLEQQIIERKFAKEVQGIVEWVGTLVNVANQFLDKDVFNQTLEKVEEARSALLQLSEVIRALTHRDIHNIV
jgi:TPP-dependent pyruvate/acetoin dehydrogenase alpha subunit